MDVSTAADSLVADGELGDLRELVGRLRAENARLLRLLELSPREAAAPGPAQAGWFDASPGPVHAGTAAEDKVAFFAALFAARKDVYALRWDNERTGRGGWLPTVRGGWRKGVPHRDRDYLPLTAEVITAHLSGQVHLGLYPLLDGDRCCWLAADFDGPAALLDALAYLKAARAASVPAALEVSRSGLGAHVWIFFTAPVAAETARRLGSGLLREAMALRGRMGLAGYDRLFPSQDVLPVGGVGNLIAAPLQGRSRRDGATVFLEPGHPGAARRPVGVPLVAVADEPAGGLPAGRPNRAGGCRHPGAAGCRGGLDADPAAAAAGRARGPGYGRPAERGRSDPGPAGDVEARGVDAEPGVLRAAAAPGGDLGHPPIPVLLRGDPRR